MNSLQTNFNSLEDAFKRGGYETNAEKLRRLMATAITADGPGRGISGPSLERFERLLLGEGDAELVWALFEAVRAEVLRKLFNEVLAEVKAGKDFGGRGTLETHIWSAPENDAAAETGICVQSAGSVSQPSAVVPIHSAKPLAPRERPHAPPGGGVNGMMTVVKWQKDSWLRRITIGNRPIATMHRAELEQAIRTTGRNKSYLELIRDRWPPHADNETVEFWLSDADGDKLYEQAKELADA